MVERAAFCVPPSRSLRVSQRVSTPLMPGTPDRSSQSASGRDARQFDTVWLRCTDHHRRDLSPIRFIILQVDAHIPDMGYRKQYPLSPVRRVGQYFLVTRHAGVEDQFKHSIGSRAKGLPFEDCSVL